MMERTELEMLCRKKMNLENDRAINKMERARTDKKLREIERSLERVTERIVALTSVEKKLKYNFER